MQGADPNAHRRGRSDDHWGYTAAVGVVLSAPLLAATLVMWLDPGLEYPTSRRPNIPTEVLFTILTIAVVAYFARLVREKRHVG